MMLLKNASPFLYVTSSMGNTVNHLLLELLFACSCIVPTLKSIAGSLHSQKYLSRCHKPRRYALKESDLEIIGSVLAYINLLPC
jgi:hypothetical protein